MLKDLKGEMMGEERVVVVVVVFKANRMSGDEDDNV